MTIHHSKSLVVGTPRTVAVGTSVYVGNYFGRDGGANFRFQKLVSRGVFSFRAGRYHTPCRAPSNIHTPAIPSKPTVRLSGKLPTSRSSLKKKRKGFVRKPVSKPWESDDIEPEHDYFRDYVLDNEQKAYTLNHRYCPKICGQYLDLSRKGLTTVPDFTAHENLTWLVLAHNNITELLHAAMLTNLTHLYARDNSITTLDALVHLRFLSTLDVAHNKLVDITPLRHSRSIRVLDLSHNLIGEVAMEVDTPSDALASCHHQDYLSVLSTLLSVTDLWLAGNPISHTVTADRMRRTIPDLRRFDGVDIDAPDSLLLRETVTTAVLHTLWNAPPFTGEDDTSSIRDRERYDEVWVVFVVGCSVPVGRVALQPAASYGDARHAIASSSFSSAVPLEYSFLNLRGGLAPVLPLPTASENEVSVALSVHLCPFLSLAVDQFFCSQSELSNDDQCVRFFFLDPIRWPSVYYGKLDIEATPVLLPSLHEAAHSQGVVAVSALLIAGASADWRDSSGRTALHHACAAGDLDSALVLVERSDHVGTRDSSGRTPLHECALRRRWDMFTTLLSKTSDPLRALTLPDKTNVAAADLLLAVYIDLPTAVRLGRTPVVSLALQLQRPHSPAPPPHALTAMAAVGYKDAVFQRTALHEAALKGDVSAATALVDAGASLWARDSQHRLPLHCAASHRGSAEVAEFLLAHMGVLDALQALDAGKRTALHIALHHRNLDVARVLSMACARVLASSVGSEDDDDDDDSDSDSDSERKKKASSENEGMGLVEVANKTFRQGNAGRQATVALKSAVLEVIAPSDNAIADTAPSKKRTAQTDRPCEFLEVCDASGCVVLCMAAALGDAEVVRALLACGVRVHRGDGTGNPTLSVRRAESKVKRLRGLLRRAESHRYPTISSLQKERHKRDGRGGYALPLYYAVYNGHAEVAAVLAAAMPTAMVVAMCEQFEAVHRRTHLVGAVLARGHVQCAAVLVDALERDSTGTSDMNYDIACLRRAQSPSNALAQCVDQYAQSALFEACKAGDPLATAAWLAAGSDANHRDHEGMTPLLNAALSGSVDTVEVLLDGGAAVGVLEANTVSTDVTTSTATKTTATTTITTITTVTVITQMLTYHAVVAASAQGRLDIVLKLLSRGGSVNERDPDQTTPLIAAASAGHHNLVLYLLDQGASVLAVDESMWTALMHAVAHGHSSVAIELLNAGAHPNLAFPKDDNDPQTSGHSMLYVAWRDGDAAVVLALIRAGAVLDFVTFGGSALPQLTSDQSDTRVDVLDPAVCHLSDVCAWQRFPVDDHTVDEPWSRGDGQLRRHWARPSYIDRPTPMWPEDQVPLHCTCAVCYLTELVVAARQDPNSANDETGQTALMRAVLDNDYQRVCELLREGALPDIKDMERLSALDLAAQAGQADIVEVLLCAGASATESALVLACEGGSMGVVAQLLAAGVSAETRDRVGMTVLMLASAVGDVLIVQQLLAHGASVRARDPMGFSVLHFAVLEDHAEVVAALCAAGADVHARLAQPTAEDDDGDAPSSLSSTTAAGSSAEHFVFGSLLAQDDSPLLLIACQSGDEASVAALLAYGAADGHAGEAIAQEGALEAARLGVAGIVRRLLAAVPSVATARDAHGCGLYATAQLWNRAEVLRELDALGPPATVSRDLLPETDESVAALLRFPDGAVWRSLLDTVTGDQRGFMTKQEEWLHRLPKDGSTDKQTLHCVVARAALCLPLLEFVLSILPGDRLDAQCRLPWFSVCKPATALHVAAWVGHSPAVALLLRAGASADVPKPECGQQALMVAVKAGHVDTVRMLVEANANIEDALLHAATWNQEKVALLLLQFLSSAAAANKPRTAPAAPAAAVAPTAAPTADTDVGGEEATPVAPESLRLATEVQAVDAHKATVLHWACYWGMLVLPRALLDAGLSVDVMDDYALPPPVYALAMGRTKVTAVTRHKTSKVPWQKLLDDLRDRGVGWFRAYTHDFASATAALTETQITDPLPCAELTGEGDASPLTAESDSDDGYDTVVVRVKDGGTAAATTAATAAAAAAEAAANTEGEETASGSDTDWFTVPPAYLCCWKTCAHGSLSRGSLLHFAVWARNVGLARLALRCGVPVDSGDVGCTALQAAAWLGDLDMVSMLVKEASASVECVGHARSPTPLVCAVMQGHAHVALLLLQSGSSACAPIGAKIGLLHAAVMHNMEEVAAFLLDNDMAAVNDADHAHRYPLHYAKVYKRPLMERLLIERGALVDCRPGSEVIARYDPIEPRVKNQFDPDDFELQPERIAEVAAYQAHNDNDDEQPLVSLDEQFALAVDPPATARAEWMSYIATNNMPFLLDVSVLPLRASPADDGASDTEDGTDDVDSIRGGDSSEESSESSVENQVPPSQRAEPSPPVPAAKPQASSTLHFSPATNVSQTHNRYDDAFEIDDDAVAVNNDDDDNDVSSLGGSWEHVSPNDVQEVQAEVDCPQANNADENEGIEMEVMNDDDDGFSGDSEFATPLSPAVNDDDLNTDHGRPLSPSKAKAVRVDGSDSGSESGSNSGSDDDASSVDSEAESLSDAGGGGDGDRRGLSLAAPALAITGTTLTREQPPPVVANDGAGSDAASPAAAQAVVSKSAAPLTVARQMVIQEQPLGLANFDEDYGCDGRRVGDSEGAEEATAEDSTDWETATEGSSGDGGVCLDARAQPARKPRRRKPRPKAALPQGSDSSDRSDLSDPGGGGPSQDDSDGSSGGSHDEQDAGGQAWLRGGWFGKRVMSGDVNDPVQASHPELVRQASGMSLTDLMRETSGSSEATGTGTLSRQGSCTSGLLSRQASGVSDVADELINNDDDGGNAFAQVSAPAPPPPVLTAEDARFQMALDLAKLEEESLAAYKPDYRPVIERKKREWQSVRVFVSSTFQDTFSEREHLVKTVMPELKQRAYTRRLHLFECDLRWGVPMDTPGEETLKVCLAEVDRCRKENICPFLIGILGERWGWTPEFSEISDEIRTKWNWIDGLSVTAMEMVHGAVRDRNPNAFFFARDSSFLEEDTFTASGLFPDDVATGRRLRAGFLDVEWDTTKNPIEPLFPEKRHSICEIKRTLFKELLVRLFKERGQYVDGYQVQFSSIDWKTKKPKFTGLHKTFGKPALEKLWGAISAQYPLAEAKNAVNLVEDEMARNALYHESFVEARAGVFVGRHRVLRELVDYTQGNDPNPFVVTAVAGSGKSALMAKYVATVRELDDVHCVYHFVGVGPNSTSILKVLTRLITEVKLAYGLTHPAIIAEYPDLCASFGEVLQAVPSQKKLLVVVDALNQLDTADQADVLDWLPTRVPKNVRIVLSLLPGKTLTLLQTRKGLRFHQLDMLSQREQAELVRLTLATYNKTLSETPTRSLLLQWADKAPRSEELSEACKAVFGIEGSLQVLPECGVVTLPKMPTQRQLQTFQGRMGGVATVSDNQMDALIRRNISGLPLWLMVACEELRVFGLHEQVNTKIMQFPVMVQSLLEQVLERLEEQHSRSVVESALSYLVLAQAGLLESELRGLLGTKKSPLPFAIWAALLRDLAFCMRPPGETGEGAIDFFHRAMAKAVMHRYNVDGNRCVALHRKMSIFFKDVAERQSRQVCYEDFPRALRAVTYHQRQGGISVDVLVSVRVRPFNQMEIDQGSSCIVDMVGAQTIIRDPSDPKKKKDVFSFDFSFWSHDDSKPFRSTQETVYNMLGADVIQNAWDGFNVSLFAYGQTGAGKSHTMFGQDLDGLIPRICSEIFRRVSSEQDKYHQIDVTLQMFEIYKEAVYCLLSGKNEVDNDIRVREDPATGPFVEGAECRVVQQYTDVELAIKQGEEAKTVAATNMNERSSRAHTLVVLTIVHTFTNEKTKKSFQRRSKVNLVDLAGSERARTRGDINHRIVDEGIAINKSLSLLNRCISMLSANTGVSMARHHHIPYRDSRLTWIMKDSLGGRSKTIMFCAISPASINYNETRATLDYAQKAKRIVNVAAANEDEDMGGSESDVEPMDGLPANVTQDQVIAQRQELEAMKKARAEALAPYDVLLDEARGFLNRVTKADLSEVKSYSKPPQLVAETMGALVMVFNGKPPIAPWDECKRMLSQPTFLQRLLQFDASNIPSTVHARLSQLSVQGDITVEKLEKISCLAKYIWQWLLAVIKFTESISNVSPKLSELRRCEQGLARLEAGYKESKERARIAAENEQLKKKREAAASHGLSKGKAKAKKAVAATVYSSSEEDSGDGDVAFKAKPRPVQKKGAAMFDSDNNDDDAFDVPMAKTKQPKRKEMPSKKKTSLFSDDDSDTPQPASKPTASKTGLFDSDSDADGDMFASKKGGSKSEISSGATHNERYKASLKMKKKK